MARIGVLEVGFVHGIVRVVEEAPLASSTGGGTKSASGLAVARIGFLEGVLVVGHVLLDSVSMPKIALSGSASCSSVSSLSFSMGDKSGQHAVFLCLRLT